MTRIDEWAFFAQGWIGACRRARRSASYALLAVAMADADFQRHRWDYYTTMAAAQTQRFSDEENPVLMRRLEDFTLRGWVFEHDAAGWVAVHVLRTTPRFWQLRDLLASLGQQAH
jgi:hypothetical protein